MSKIVYPPHSNYYPPTVIERDGNQERGYDIYSRLLKDRIVFIGTPIDDFVANQRHRAAAVSADGGSEEGY